MNGNRWDAWKKTDSKARQGKGFNPNLDKCFLEFLVATEIDFHSYAHDLETSIPVERYMRHIEKVRRVALSRIGQERFEAYRARVKEAFTSYVQGADYWTTWDGSSSASASSSGGGGRELTEATALVSEDKDDTDPHVAMQVDEEDEARGRDTTTRRSKREYLSTSMDTKEQRNKS